MKVIDILQRGYNHAYDKYEAFLFVKILSDCPSIDKYRNVRRLFDTAEEMYSLKVGDIVE